ncbi:carbohydrate ABC transporter permease [Eggerthella timonensis]|uniref:carbohydrate ABC transporter permease n=1 Tax=Eggerthella timonensis TaxID=1871008 RepID=UPI000C77291B|nr:carbohydrate ABC transporter permease [Eggerthella timonensis]
MTARSRLVPLALAVVGFVVCFPLAVLIVGSFMGNEELASTLGGVVAPGAGFANAPLVPSRPTLASYVAVLVDTPAYHVLVQNSAIIVVDVLAGQAVFATPAAWALTRFDFPGKRAVFFLYVLLMMLPFQVVMLPNYLVLNALGINDTLLSVVLPGAFSAFPVFIMHHFFASVPDSLVDAARLDGAGEWRVFWSIGLPLGAPGVFAALVLGFFEYWNAVEQPLAFLKNQALWPLSLFQPALSAETVGTLFAAAVVAAVPAVLVFLMGKDYLEQGIAATTGKDR